MTIYVDDKFSGSNGTLVVGDTPDVGSTWESWQNFGHLGDVEMDGSGNARVKTGSSQNYLLNTTVLGGNDGETLAKYSAMATGLIEVFCNMDRTNFVAQFASIDTTSSSASSGAGAVLTFDSWTTTYGGGAWDVNYNNGNGGNNNYFTDPALLDGGNHTLMIAHHGTGAALIIDGDVALTATGASTTSGFAAFRPLNTPANGGPLVDEVLATYTPNTVWPGRMWAPNYPSNGVTTYVENPTPGLFDPGTGKWTFYVHMGQPYSSAGDSANSAFTYQWYQSSTVSVRGSALTSTGGTSGVTTKDLVVAVTATSSTQDLYFTCHAIDNAGNSVDSKQWHLVVPATPAGIVVVDGDSIDAFGSPQNYRNHFYWAGAAHRSGLPFQNFAVSGSTFPGGIKTDVDVALSPFANKMLWIGGGTNDMAAGQTGAQSYAAQKAYAQAYIDTGHITADQIVFRGVLARDAGFTGTDAATFEINRQAERVLKQADFTIATLHPHVWQSSNPSSAKAKFWYDCGAESHLGAGGTTDADSTTYFVGQIHPLDPGHIILTAGFNFIVDQMIPPAPAAPTSLTATANSSSQITLTWTPAAGGTSQTIYRGLTSGSETSSHTIGDGTTTSYVDTGLSASTAYYYKITATNAGGESDYSNEAHDTTDTGQSFTTSPTTVPANHSGDFVSTLTGSGESWTPGTPGTPTFAITNSVSGTTTFTKTAQSISGANAATVTGHTGAGTGTYTIGDGTTTATVTVGTGSFTISPTTGAAGASQSLTLTGTNKIWTLETAAGLFTVSGGSIGTPSFSTDNAGTVTLTNAAVGGAITITDTSDGTTQTFTVAPAAPTNLAATAPADAQIKLTWTASTGATSYSIFRGTTPGGESGTALATGVTGTTYVDTGLSAATLYYYKIKAVGAGGTSPASNEASATTTNLPRPTNLAFGPGALGAKTFEWDAVAYGSDTITYVVKRRRAGVLTTLSASQSENTYTIAVVDQLNNDTYLVAAKNGSGAVSAFASKIFNPTDEEIMIPIDSATVSVPTGSGWTTIQDVSTDALKVEGVSFDATAPADADVELQVCVRTGASGQIVTIIDTVQMVHSLLAGNYPVPRGTTSSFNCRVPEACDSVVIRGRHNASSTKTITTVGSLA